MATRTYKAADRGKLVTVGPDDKMPVYTRPEDAGLTDERIVGPVTVGTATGNMFTDTKTNYEYIEVVRASVSLLFGTPIVSKIYMLTDNVTLKDNPAYDASNDTSVQIDNEDGTGVTTNDNDEVSTTPGKGRVAVTAADGKTVYVLTPGVDEPDDTTPIDKTKKWLTIGLYVVIGLAVIALVTIMVLSFSKKKPVPALR